METFTVKKLSSSFYNDFSPSEYPEILSNIERPYNILLFSLNNTYDIGVPFRTHMRHRNGYLFSSATIPHSKPGLDYSKLIIFEKQNYIGDAVMVDNDQYAEVVQNIATISKEIHDYIEVYVQHKKGIKVLHPREYSRKYGFSTLPYFRHLLNI